MIRVHADPAVLTLDVQGRATMAESPAVQAIVSKQASRDVRDVRVDLRDCMLLDSTFLGMLLSLARQLGKAGGTVTLVSPSPKIVDVLRQMGLEDFYPIENSERAPGPWLELRPEDPDVERLRSLVLDSHEELARVPGPAAQTFRAVVEELRRNHEPQSGEANG